MEYFISQHCVALKVKISVQP